MNTNFLIVAAIASTVALTGCKNPAADVTPATVNEPVEEEASAADPTPEATGETPTPVATSVVSFGPDTSTISWTGSKVTGTHTGLWSDFTGTLTLNADDFTQSTVTVTLQTASMTADSDRLQGHLHSPDFFDVATHPTATFTSTGIVVSTTEGATHDISGNLTISGQTNNITFPANVAITDAAVTVSSEFSINRQNWGIVYAGMPDDLIRDEVVLNLDINAAR